MDKTGGKIWEMHGNTWKYMEIPYPIIMEVEL